MNYFHAQGYKINGVITIKMFVVYAFFLAPQDSLAGMSLVIQSHGVQTEAYILLSGILIYMISNLK